MSDIGKIQHLSYQINQIDFIDESALRKMLCNISNTRNSVSSGYPIIEKRVENKSIF